MMFLAEVAFGEAQFAWLSFFCDTKDGHDDRQSVVWVGQNVWKAMVLCVTGENEKDLEMMSIQYALGVY